jgi:hypothetical protein
MRADIATACVAKLQFLAPDPIALAREISPTR